MHIFRIKFVLLSLKDVSVHVQLKKILFSFELIWLKIAFFFLHKILEFVYSSKSCWKLKQYSSWNDVSQNSIPNLFLAEIYIIIAYIWNYLIFKHQMKQWWWKHSDSSEYENTHCVFVICFCDKFHDMFTRCSGMIIYIIIGFPLKHHHRLPIYKNYC